MASLDGSWDRAHQAALRVNPDDRERVVSIDLGLQTSLSEQANSYVKNLRIIRIDCRSLLVPLIG